MDRATALDSDNHEYWGQLGAYAKRIPGGEARAAAALKKASALARAKVRPVYRDYDLHAALAEYCARLGEAQESLSEAAKVPRSASQVYALRLLTSYEIAGARKKAVEMAGPSLNRASLQNLIKDHPDLGGLWQDPQFQAALQPARKL